MIITVKNYLSEAQAEKVLTFLNERFSATTGRERGVQRFGETLSYTSHKISKDIPEVLNNLSRKLEDDGFVQDIRHVTVNRYDVGQGIPFHIDTKEAGEVISIISLASDATLLFKDGKGKVARHPIPANSLVQFSEDHRYKMKHSIEPVTQVRYSIVFRKH